MATDLENLQARRTAICAELAALGTTKAGGKPNSTAAGVDHVGYKKSLYEELAAIDQAIAAAEGPWLEYSEAFAG
jgi:hypothetical protein